MDSDNYLVWQGKRIPLANIDVTYDVMGYIRIVTQTYISRGFLNDPDWDGKLIEVVPKPIKIEQGPELEQELERVLEPITSLEILWV